MKRRFILKSGALALFYPLFRERAFAADCSYTSSDIEGPFYSPNAPAKQNLAPEGAAGTPLFITGTVYARDCITPVPLSRLDVWQADHGGAYDNAGFNYRGVFDSDNLGNYSFETILPGKYLNGNYYRPRHIHFKINGGGSGVLTTQLYFEGDTSIPDDPWASDPGADGRIIPLNQGEGGNLHGVFDVYLDVDKDQVTGNPELRNQFENPGNRILSIYPTPVRESATISVNIAGIEARKAELVLFNIYGQTVRTQAIPSFQGPSADLPFRASNSQGLKLQPGIYIVQLRINGRVTDAKRVILE